jgi:probable FeS assembly SUF system protein SufT
MDAARLGVVSSPCRPEPRETKSPSQFPSQRASGRRCVPEASRSPETTARFRTRLCPVFGYIGVRMSGSNPVTLTRDVEAALVPVGTKVTLMKGEQAYITQSLGGSYTVIVNGNMFRIEGKDADALGLPVQTPTLSTGKPMTREEVEKQVWEVLKTCYDPEIPVNIVDLGLIYDCVVTPIEGKPDTYRVDVKMTLTAPGCGMGPMIAQDAQNKILSIEAVEEANVEVVWDPPWNQSMLSEAAKLQLGLL